MSTTYNQIAARGIERIAALSDGLFAIAMTLIVLEIGVPAAEGIRSEADLAAALAALAPRIVAFLLSFLTLGIFWSGQQTQLNHFRQADRHLSWIYLAFLASISIMPFSTGLLAEFHEFRLAIVVYWLNIVVPGSILYGSWVYGERHGFLKADTSPAVGAAVRRRIIIAQSLYAIGALLSLINPAISIAFIVLVQLNFAIAPRIWILDRI
jgi:uncharacterized membrane protein